MNEPGMGKSKNRSDISATLSEVERVLYEGIIPVSIFGSNLYQPHTPLG